MPQKPAVFQLFPDVCGQARLLLNEKYGKRNASAALVGCQEKRGVTTMHDKQSILLVDDDREYCKATQKFLERRGYAVTSAIDGREALNAIIEETFDLILSDLRMPNLDGIDLMHEIRRRNIETPVIFVTGHGEVESYMDLMNMGAFDYLNKPVDARRLLSIIQKVLGHPSTSINA
jgi:DNA-binding NtrC family response regulator